MLLKICMRLLCGLGFYMFQGVWPEGSNLAIYSDASKKSHLLKLPPSSLSPFNTNLHITTSNIQHLIASCPSNTGLL